MKNESKSLLLILGLLVLVIGLSACGYISTPGDGIVAIPHSIDWGFTNCLVCHSDAALDTHADFTLYLCSTPACHPLMSDLPTFTPTYTPPPVTTTTGTPLTTTITESPGPISSESHIGQTDTSLCGLCHLGASPILANPEDHADYANDSCYDADCHEPPE